MTDDLTPGKSQVREVDIVAEFDDPVRVDIHDCLADAHKNV
jgi:hypothetical protein